MHKITKNLQNFYDSEAEKFSSTRKRHWPEFDHILKHIDDYLKTKEKRGNNTMENATLRILELGCGDGRLMWVIEEALIETWVILEYVWVDISYNLLQIADKKFPHGRRIHEDMLKYMQDIDQEYFDIVIAIASFHHLPNSEQRSKVLEWIYGGLVYGGEYIMTNWCYSDWFKKRFAPAIKKSFWKSLLTLWYFNKNDIMVPRKTPEGKLVADRLYHIFTPKELGNLMIQSGFSRIEQVYITNDWEISNNEKVGRNMVTSGIKSIYR